ncbi:hypothetical protein EVAR_41930_1 [Eumeta japonica]|uniref:Uncharacterized protein n=1 Tax=Eumeta variegata TaxID=151549 RepID=A0A4C1XK21_EUMVA|nr:hypothetical protein EVAR_41930_1 [Eumeta japonica]
MRRELCGIALSCCKSTSFRFTEPGNFCDKPHALASAVHYVSRWSPFDHLKLFQSPPNFNYPTRHIRLSTRIDLSAWWVQIIDKLFQVVRSGQLILICRGLGVAKSVVARVRAWRSPELMDDGALLNRVDYFRGGRELF